MRCVPPRLPTRQFGTTEITASGDVTAARRFVVKGRVQGVWFRDSTRKEAQRLGITGHAVNLPDGGVEVFANGSDDALRALETWLRKGPPLARVSQLIAEDARPDGAEGFSTG